VRKLQDLAPEWAGDEREVSAVVYDSRACKPGSVFFAFPGIHTQGANYIADAIQNGAIAVVSDHPVLLPENVAGLVDPLVRTRFASVCSRFHGEPESRLSIIGVTGTDGKSTTSEYLYQLLQRAGRRTALIGTVSMDDGSGYGPSPYRQSTPEADQLEAFLDRCLHNGVEYVVLECTSHALSDRYDRLHTIRYDGGIVTTVTSEHLEFHGSVPAYVDAKCNLARRIKQGGFFISTTVNPHLDAFLNVLPARVQSLVVNQNVQAEIGLDASITYRGKAYPTPLHYPVLAGNALLACLAAARILHTPLAQQLALACALKPVDGRMVTVENHLGLTVLIDFAHTADAYEKLFSFEYQRKGQGRILACFGCAGERDTSKRAPMGKTASHYGDILFLTDEDPRWEPTEQIDRDLLRDAEPVEVHEIADRAKAIQAMVDAARPGDTLLFLGKGHEHSIEKQGVKYAWNERNVVEEALRRRESREMGGIRTR